MEIIAFSMHYKSMCFIIFYMKIEKLYFTLIFLIINNVWNFYEYYSFHKIFFLFNVWIVNQNVNCKIYAQKYNQEHFLKIFLIFYIFRCLSCLTYWAPFLKNVCFLPQFIFPFVKLFQSNFLLSFEISATIICKFYIILVL